MNKLLAAVTVLAVSIATVGPAYAEVIVFTNPAEGEPGYFNWDLGQFSQAGTWLDITRPSTDQGGLVGPTSVGQIFSNPPGGSGWFNKTSAGAMVAQAPPPLNMTRAFLAGATIDSQLDFTTESTHAFLMEGKGSFVISLFGQPTGNYMAVRFDDIDGSHYGWIGVVGPGKGTYGLELDAFAWGYETEPGVPIIAGIPAPGTLLALVIGAAVTRRRRRRD